MSEKGWHNLPLFFTHHIGEYMQEVAAQFFEAGLVQNNRDWPR